MKDLYNYYWIKELEDYF